MNSNFQVNRTEICNICGCRELSILARRSDNLDVLICQHCSMGVLELFPNDTALLYGDDYYESDKTAVASGYADYDANSEHGVLWATEIVKLITDSGRVLDIGCANGFLLNALGFGYETFGIEANEKAANFAETIGVKIIGNDILDPKLLLEFASYFDVITAIAVFEHIEDFKGAVQAALKMLKPDGVLIFEVPLISENPDSNTWFTSSLEHLFYPTEKGLRYLFNNQLNTQMIGGELVIRDYASTFFGMATSSDSTLFRIKDIYEKIRFSLPIDSTPAERRAQLLLKVIHAADSQPNNLLGSSSY
jgi:SAM-dependent methyltransferase